MKLSITLLSAVLAGAVVCALPANLRSQEKQEKKADTKETKLQGSVVRINKDSKIIDIRGGVKNEDHDMRKILYDDATQWTNLGKPGKMDEVKEGSFIIILGHMQGDGSLHATRIDLRLPR